MKTTEAECVGLQKCSSNLNSYRASQSSACSSGIKTPFPDINCREIIQSLKMECQYLQKEDSYFQALNPKRLSKETNSKLMHTQLRSLTRRQREEVKRSFTLCPGQENKVYDEQLSRFPSRMYTFANTKHENEQRKTIKSTQNVKASIWKDAASWGCRPIVKNQFALRRKSRSTVKPFECLVRELRDILMRT